MHLFEEWSRISKIVVVSSLIFLGLIPDTAFAQIIPDSSLGTENSVVDTNSNRDTINGGAIRDANLFHSFQEFNVEALREAYFTNPDGIANIFSRVTGNNISDIQGVLGVLGDANLYLINPNGILFGENARLDVNGSFFATTADSVLFENGFEFSAANPDAPPLLTIDIPIGLRFRDNPGEIVNRSTANNGNGLEVSVGENITLVGGKINLAGGNIFAPGGKVELGGLSAAGEISIDSDGSLSFPERIERADITLTNAAEVDVRAAGGGSISVNARNFEISGGELGKSSLFAGIAPESGLTTAQAGDININATDTITVSQESRISNRVEESGVGNSGDINITTTNLFLTQGSVVTASTFGQGKGGVITVNALGTISADGEGQDGISSGIYSAVADTAVGNSGGIKITTTNLSLTQGGRVDAATRGRGDAGTIAITTSGTISVDGESSDGSNSSIFSGVNSTAVGNSGGIEITTTNLSLTQGADIDASTRGQGDAGEITIEASGTISADGEDSDGFTSGIFSNVNSTGLGNSEGINITTNNLSLTQGGVVTASTFGQGDAGAITINASGTISADGEGTDGFASGIFSDVSSTGLGNSEGINITTNNLSLTQGGVVTASTFGQGNAGEITINASGIIFADGEDSDGFSSGVFSQVAEGEGDSGGINITTNNLSLTQGSVVDASTFGQGDAGRITIKASGTISADGEDSDGFSSGVFSTVASTGDGDTEGIQIITNNLSLTQGGRVDASTFGQGDAGEITIEALGTISADGENQGGFSSGIFSQVTGTGNAGEIDIATTNLSLTQGGRVDSSTFGQGDAGAIIINASGTISADGEDTDGFGSGIVSALGSKGKGNAGKINITTTDLSLTRGSVVNASTFGQGDAGGITIESSGTISADGEDTDGRNSGVFSTVASTAVGNSGEINITTIDLSLTRGGVVNASTFGQGDAEAITIEASGTISVNGKTQAGFNSGIVSGVEDTAVGNSKGIDINTHNLSLTQGGRVDTGSRGQGNAGAIIINASGTISANGETQFASPSSSGIFSASAGVGNSGEIKITTTDLFLTQGGQVSASFVFGKKGEAGAITINASGTISADGENQFGAVSGIYSAVTFTDEGNSGGIDITTTDLLLTQGGQVNSSTAGQGEAEGIRINALGTILADGEGQFRSGIYSEVTFIGRGNSGGIDIMTTDLLLTQGGQVNSSTSGQGNAGEITIEASGTISADGEDTDGFSSGIFSRAGDRGAGDAKGINISTNDLFLKNNAQISVESGGQGNAGDIFIQANSLALSNGSSLLASTPVETGGSIFLTIADNLTLRDNSTISARALENANGGNVNIDAKFIIAFPNQNNDIIASASQGRGGEINITTEGIFGLEERSSTPPNQTNDIDASSEFGLSGEVTITRPDVDPTSGLLELTQEVVDPAKLIAQNVCTQTADSEFVDIGKGGLPQNPEDRLAEDAIEVGLVAPIITSSEATETTRERIAIKPSHTRKPPAQGWIVHDNGIVELVAYNPNQVGETTDLG